MQDIDVLLEDPTATAQVETAWEKINRDFATAYSAMPIKHMARTELSFHSHIKLLGYLALAVGPVEGDIVEIGVWKGMSLAFMQRLCSGSARLIGIDPFELPGQAQEASFFWKVLFPDCALIQGYSQNAIEKALQVSTRFKLLHIDGGHTSENVWSDFLLYERFVVPGGYIVFDDYGDVAHSPEVGPAVDRLRTMGLFKDYVILGQLRDFENSYVLRKVSAIDRGPSKTG